MTITPSGSWNFFRRQIGEQIAFVFFDDGISSRINGIDLPDLLKVRLTFKKPRADGLPLQEEFEALSALEDRLTPLIKQAGGLYVGRITVNGHRYFHFFVPAETDPARQISQLAAQTGYGLKFAIEADPKKEGYWRDLYPDDDERQVIGDQDVFFNLQKHGDNPDIERQIDHLAYFPTGKARAEFQHWAETEGYRIVQMTEDANYEMKFLIEFVHVGRTKLDEISSHTVAISRKAREVGGWYDGWGTTAETQ